MRQAACVLEERTSYTTSTEHVVGSRPIPTIAPRSAVGGERHVEQTMRYGH